MSRENKKYYYYAEITIEAATPLVLASGKTGNFFDVELVRDANGLPAIPGTTIAGILRHIVRERNGTEIEAQLFGFQNENDGFSSSLEVSWAYIHDSKNKIHKSFYSKTEIEDDPILKEVYIKDNPDFKRDHVNLTDKGVAKETGKFDRYFVPTGSRFTFSIGLWSENKEDSNWTEILNILFSPAFRIGAAGRAGYGKIKVIEINIPENNYFDLSKTEDINSFKNCSKKYELLKDGDDIEKIELKLQFPLGFRIGGGSRTFLDSKHSADMLPYSEKVIKWNGDIGNFVSIPRITIPGSSIKGAIRHRAAYHLARLNKKWAFEIEDDDGLSELFGYATNLKDSESIGKAGKLWFTDLYLEDTKTYELSRNSIDRFTGGTLDGALFQEENVYSNKVYAICIYLDKRINKDSCEYKAFEWAIEDLKTGRLALGGGVGHGLGFNHTEEEQ